MKKKNNLELKVGAFSLVAIIILTLGSLWGRDVRIGGGSIRLEFLFPQSGGLIVGDPVTVNGVKKGRVTHVGLDGRFVKIAVQIDSDVELYADLKARIEMLDLMGGNKLEIFPGASEIPLSPERMRAPFFGDAVAGMGTLLAEAVQLKTEVDSVVMGLQSTLDQLVLLLDTEKVVRPLHGSIANLEALTGRLRVLMDENAGHLDQSMKDIAYLSGSMRNFLESRKDTLDQAVKTLLQTTARLDTFSLALRTIGEQFDKKEGTVARLIYSDETYDRLLRTIDSVDSLAVDIRRNLARYLQNTDISLFNLIHF